MLVLLVSDHSGEDERYVIGSIDLPDSVPLEKFEHEAIELMDEIRREPEYEDEDLMIELERRGYKRGDVPYEIIVRD